MVQIINAFARGNSPIAQTISNLGSMMFGDQTGAAINREQLRTLERENDETENLMALLSEAGGAQNLGANPTAQALMVGSGYDPANFGELGLMGAASQFGAGSPEVDDWMMGTGGSYNSTAQAFNLNLGEDARQANQTDATNRWEFNQEPINVLGADGTPQIMRQGGDLSAAAPILNLTEQQGTLLGNMFPTLTPQQQRVAVDAEPSETQYRAGQAAELFPTWDQGEQDRYMGVEPTPRTYWTPDGHTGTTWDEGATDAQTRATLPPGTKVFTTNVNAPDPETVTGVTTPLVRSRNAIEDALAIGEDLLAAAKAAPPEAFGASGAIANFVRGTLNTVANVAGLVGVEMNSATLQNWVHEQSPNLSDSTIALLFGPDANATQALAGLYTYQAAATMSGQSGQDLSDKDVANVTSQIGDPRGWGMDQTTFVAGVERMQGMMQAQLGRLEERLVREGPLGAWGADPPVGEPGQTPIEVPPIEPAGGDDQLVEQAPPYDPAVINLANVAATAEAHGVSDIEAMQIIADYYGVPLSQVGADYQRALGSTEGNVSSFRGIP